MQAQREAFSGFSQSTEAREEDVPCVQRPDGKEQGAERDTREVEGLQDSAERLTATAERIQVRRVFTVRSDPSAGGMVG